MLCSSNRVFGAPISLFFGPVSRILRGKRYIIFGTYAQYLQRTWGTNRRGRGRAPDKSSLILNYTVLILTCHFSAADL